MRRYLVWMLAALFALLPVAGSAADNRDTQITTTLPEEHTITVVCGAGGGFRVNGTVYTGEKAFSVERLSAFELGAVPDAGYRLSQVKAQPSGGVSITGNTVTIGSVYEDKTLTLSFVREDPKPTPTPTPSPAPTTDEADGETDESDTLLSFDLPYVTSKDNVLYDRYLGTGGGLSELGIVYDETYELDEYELLAVLYEEDQAAKNTLLVIAQPDEDGAYAQRSLILSGLQLARLWQEKKIERIELRSGDASALVRIEELLSGDAAKFIDWALANPEAARPEEAWELPDAELTAGQLGNIRIEVRIAPDEQGGYRFGVYAWYAGVQQAIGELTPSFQVCISAGEQGGEEERAAYVAAHALSATDETGATEHLQSALIETPVREAEDRTDLAEYFSVSMEDGLNPIVLYDPVMPLDRYRRWSLCAYWTGDAAYRLEDLEAEQ